MKKLGITIILLAATALPAFAGHGPLTGTQRDSWINSDVEALVSAGWIDPLSKPARELTNLEVAQLTSKAAQVYLASGFANQQATMDKQASSANSATPAPAQTADAKKLRDLAWEFQDELSAMDVDVAKLEDHIYEQEHRNERFATIQKEYLKRTGTALSGYARGYFNTYRGFGPNAIYGPMDYNNILFGDVILKSVPVPFVLFDADIRLSRTIGLYYADPVQPNFNLRWVSLTNTNDVANLTAGDFYRSYTPLTLWNYDVPVYTLLEPTSYQRVRKDIESLVFMDHGPDEHMRGFEVSSDQALGKDSPLSSFHAEAMGGQMQATTPSNFSSYYAGSEAAIDFFEDHLEIKGTGLMLWDDNADSIFAYSAGNPASYVRQYQVGSLSAHLNLPIVKDVTFTGSAEYAGSYYQDDANNAASTLSDSAILANGDLGIDTVHLTAKFIDNGVDFYSPGAQTNRYTPLAQGGYSLLDDGTNGYLNNFVFQGVNRPTLAPYDRMAENILPYGDATPNRWGVVLGLSAELLKDGWLKLQGSCVPYMQEIQPDMVGSSIVGGPASGATRTFLGYEGALTANLSKAMDGLPKTCSIGLDYKYQSSDPGTGANPFTVNTFIASADAGPFPDIPLFDGLVLSAALEIAQSSGSEYVLNNFPNAPTLTEFVSYFDSSMVGAFTYQPLNFSVTSIAFGFKCPLGSAMEIHGDCFINQYSWTDNPAYNRQDLIWRVTNEVSF